MSRTTVDLLGTACGASRRASLAPKLRAFLPCTMACQWRRLPALSRTTVMPLGALAQKLIACASPDYVRPSGASWADDVGKALDGIIGQIRTKAGFDLNGYKTMPLLWRIQRRMELRPRSAVPRLRGAAARRPSRAGGTDPRHCDIGPASATSTLFVVTTPDGLRAQSTFASSTTVR
jgi:hypothetical protein